MNVEEKAQSSNEDVDPDPEMRGCFTLAGSVLLFLASILAFTVPCGIVTAIDPTHADKRGLYLYSTLGFVVGAEVCATVLYFGVRGLTRYHRGR